ncbi:MAG TPA: acyl-CoA dehydrogenase family protein, partial [Smithellaceae bacterium]|nr:acyl-CoA dehydrogenase family protein [Smithellaceae bacterium]
MDFSLNDEQKILIRTLQTMGEREKLNERAAQIDRSGEFPADLLKKYGEMGLLGMTLSPDYGGGGQPALFMAVPTIYAKLIDFWRTSSPADRQG